MDGNELRPLQAPLKKRYREQPETERTPARAEAVLPGAGRGPWFRRTKPSRRSRQCDCSRGSE